MKLLALALSLLLTLSCAQSPKEGSTYYLGDFDQENQAPGRAYWVDGYFVQRKMVRRPQTPQHPYFYKSCQLDRERAHLSRRDYACYALPWITGPLGF